MKMIVLAAAVMLSMVVIGPAAAFVGEEDRIRETLNLFFDGLRSGDVAAIESLIGGKLLEETTVLLRNNQAYGDFLRDYYQGATFEVAQIHQVADGAVVDVSVIFESGARQQVSFLLVKGKMDAANSDSWKLVEQKRTAPDM